MCGRSQPNSPRLFALPVHIAAEIGSHVVQSREGFHLATLFRLRDLQAAAFRHLHPHALDRATHIGDVEFLDRLAKQLCTRGAEDPLSAYTERAITDACSSGRIAVLQWWKNSGLPLKFDGEAIHAASAAGHADVLRWWKANDLPLIYEFEAVNDASAAGHVEVLQWWKDSGLPLKYLSRAMDAASALGRVPVLQWWKDSGLLLKYSAAAMDVASMNGRVEVLQWWKESGLELKYSVDAVERARTNGHRGVVKWWRHSKLFSPQLVTQCIPSPQPMARSYGLRQLLSAR